MAATAIDGTDYSALFFCVSEDFFEWGWLIGRNVLVIPKRKRGELI